MKTKELTHAQRDVRDAAYMLALSQAPRFAGVESMMVVSAVLRDIHMRYFPAMRECYHAIGMDMHRLHYFDDAELRYVYTQNEPFHVWEIKGVLWSHDNSYAPKAEIERDFGPIMTEEQLSERLREEEIEESGVDPLASECE